MWAGRGRWGVACDEELGKATVPIPSSGYHQANTHRDLIKGTLNALKLRSSRTETSQAGAGWLQVAFKLNASNRGMSRTVRNRRDFTTTTTLLCHLWENIRVSFHYLVERVATKISKKNRGFI